MIKNDDHCKLKNTQQSADALKIQQLSIPSSENESDFVTSSDSSFLSMDSFQSESNQLSDSSHSSYKSISSKSSHHSSFSKLPKMPTMKKSTKKTVVLGLAKKLTQTGNKTPLWSKPLGFMAKQSSKSSGMKLVNYNGHGNPSLTGHPIKTLPSQIDSGVSKSSLLPALVSKIHQKIKSKTKIDTTSTQADSPTPSLSFEQNTDPAKVSVFSQIDQKNSISKTGLETDALDYPQVAPAQQTSILSFMPKSAAAETNTSLFKNLVYASKGEKAAPPCFKSNYLEELP